MTELRVFAGIDEAGLGPILGPLTIGFCAFRAPAGATNLWQTLAKVVSANPLRDKSRFVVADSKLVFARNPRGEKRLERTALGFLALLDPARCPPREAQTLVWKQPLELACGAAAREPWYGHLAPDHAPARLPRHQEAGSIELAVERLAREMRAKEVELVDAGVRVLPEAELNRSFAATSNKSVSSWHFLEPILRRMWQRYAPDRLHLVVDRQGGRFHYGPLLEQSFPDAVVAKVRERPSLSEYRLLERGDGTRRMRLTFAERGERRSFAVALASCIAKYARETCMAAFNDYFTTLDPQLKPTAGYRNDGWRWLEDAAPMLERARIDRAVLVRER